MALERNVKKKPARTADRRNVWLLILTTLLIVVSVVLFTPPNEKINQGLDIQGGLSVVLTAKSTDGQPVTPEDMEKSRAIIESRVNALGASEATVQEQGSDQILVQIPGLADTEEALATIGRTGSLEFARLDSFTDEDTAYAESNLGFESYSELDALGRCGTATACLGPETMPADDEERESISEIKPSGWDQAFYDSIRDGALWNRCHLIAWSLSAENANERNLVTGTRSMNAESMLPYEEEVARYIDRTGNHVLYRATPVFEGQELVCRGILIEAESLEDDGRGVSFSVFCVNVQPGVAIDYDTGDSHVEQEEASEPAEAREYVLNALPSARVRIRRRHGAGQPRLRDGEPRRPDPRGLRALRKLPAVEARRPPGGPCRTMTG